MGLIFNATINETAYTKMSNSNKQAEDKLWVVKQILSRYRAKIKNNIENLMVCEWTKVYGENQ